MNKFRKIAGSIILALILGIILVAFVLGDVAGVGGALRLAGADPVITRIGGWHFGPISLGGTAIKGTQVRSEFERELEQLNNRAGVQLSRDQAIMLGLPTRALRLLEQRLLLDRAIEDLGIVVSDEQVRSAILQTPAFFGPDGKFSPQQYQSVLRELKISEAQYVADLRRDIALSQLLGTTGSVAMPRLLRDALYRHRREQRIAEVVLVDPSKMTDVAAPTDEQIKSYYDANSRQFELPERRSLSFLVMTPADVAGEVQVTEEQVRAHFEDRRRQLDKPGKRDIDQVLAADEEQAKRIVELVAAGKSLEEAGKEVTGKEIIKVGVVGAADLPADLAKGVFEATEPGILAPVKSGLGWHVARLNRIVEPTVLARFEEIKEQLEQELRLQGASEILVKRTVELEKLLTRVDDLETAARELNLKLHKVEEIEASGRDAALKVAVEGPWAAEMIAAAFRLRQGETGGVGETKAGDVYVVRADKVTAPRVPPLEEIKDKIAAAWTEAERMKVAAVRAREIADRANAVAELATLARGVRSEVKTSKAITRSQADASVGLQGPLVSKLFELELGKSSAVTTESGAAVVRLREIVPADPAAAAEDADKLGKELDRAAANDLTAQLVVALERRYGVYRDMAALASQFRTGQ